MISTLSRLGVLLALPVLASCLPARFPATPLFEGAVATQEYRDGERLVRQRLEERYSIGRPEAGLAEYLSSQGFAVERKVNIPAENSTVGEARVYRRGFSDQCLLIVWGASPDGILTELAVHWEPINHF